MTEERKHSKGRRIWDLAIIFPIFVLVLAVSLAACSPVAVEPTRSAEPEPETVQPAAVVAELPATVTMIAPLQPTAVSTSTPVPTQLPLPQFSNPPLDEYQQQAAAYDVELTVIQQGNTGVWQFQDKSFLHPIGMEALDDTLYLVDGGRIMTINLANPAPPTTLLAPGDYVADVQVLEPLDLSIDNGNLLVLDRAGDVYRYEIQQDAWVLDRYDRPVEASSGHYFVAIEGQNDTPIQSQEERWTALLETNYKFTMLYDGEGSSIWNLPEGRSVDISMHGPDVYVLQRGIHELAGDVNKYRYTASVPAFKSRVPLEQPRQIVVSGSAVYILDQGGHRLLSLDPQTGSLIRIYQLPQDDLISVFTVLQDSETLILGGQDRLYFYDQPDRLLTLAGGDVNPDAQPHDYAFLESLVDFTVPIGGSNITFRDFQLPGAPRHYRLGVHHGLDFYWQPGTKVLAAGDGVIIRADVDYVPPTAGQLNSWWQETQEKGYTSPDILDDYLGRQVWIDHGSGLVSRYAHLRAIDPAISEGVTVNRRQVIGEVGNSGSPASLESEKADAHLHYELWLGDDYLGKYLRPIETREWVEQIFISR